MEKPFNFEVGDEYELDMEELKKGNMKFTRGHLPKADANLGILEIVHVDKERGIVTVRSKKDAPKHRS